MTRPLPLVRHAQELPLVRHAAELPLVRHAQELPLVRHQQALPLVRHEQALADQLLALIPQGSEICRFDRKPWHSATFAGQILTIRIASNHPLAGAKLRAFADQLPQHEFTLPRHFVGQIDAQIVDNDGGDTAIEIAALVIAE